MVSGSKIEILSTDKVCLAMVAYFTKLLCKSFVINACSAELFTAFSNYYVERIQKKIPKNSPFTPKPIYARSGFFSGVDAVY